MVRAFLFLLGAAMPLAGALKLPSTPTAQLISFESQTAEQVQAYRFADFVAQFHRKYQQGTPEWEMREKIFNMNKESVVDHLQNPRDAGWTVVVNKFADWTPEEKRRLLGYKRHKAAKMRADFSRTNHSKPEGVMEGRLEHDLDLNQKPPSICMWSNLSQTSNFIRDQGSCGSCWAVSSASVLEAYVEMEVVKKDKCKKKYPDFKSMAVSSQQIVSCTDNPNHCGGKGGCDGATAELAFQAVIKKKGICPGLKYLYTSGGDGDSGVCAEAKVSESFVHISGYVTLPSNKVNHMLQAFVQSGPMVVSVAANSFFSYGGGLLSCGTDFEVNHAVMGVGYGVTAKGEMYWMIKNSWGSAWGRKGFAMLARLEANEEEANCGWDENTHEGLACDGDPDRAWVCGNCGILFDSAYPKGTSVDC